MRWVALTAVALAVGPTGVAAFATPCAPSAPRGSSAWCPSGVRPGLRAVPIACAAAIRDLSARQILDSRGNPTVEVDLSTETGTFRASVPSGASTGEYEALELRDGDKSRWRGKGVEGPIDNIHTKILNAILGMDPTDQEAVDQRLLDADGTPDKSSLGANALLAVSLAVCKAGAASLNRPLYRHIADLVRGSGLEQAGWEARGRGKLQMPVPWLNVINGGAHAGNSLAVQEIMIGAVGASSFAEAMRAGTEVYHTLRDIIIERYGATATSVGDEGGFAPDISDIEEALGLITEAFKASGHADVMKIGLDVAASEMAVKEGTGFTYKMYPDRPPLSSDEMVKLYQDLCKGFPIVSIEDPLDQDDWEGFARMTSAMGAEVQVVGDDLTVTNPARIKRGVDEKACNALLLKVNQIGTVTEALRASSVASNAGWGVMVSHRSGETEDTFIADLAVGISSGQIKSGAPCRSERVAKYNQLLRIEEELGTDAVYAGASVLRSQIV